MVFPYFKNQPQQRRQEPGALNNYDFHVTPPDLCNIPLIYPSL